MRLNMEMLVIAVWLLALLMAAYGVCFLAVYLPLSWVPYVDLNDAEAGRMALAHYDKVIINLAAMAKVIAGFVVALLALRRPYRMVELVSVGCALLACVVCIYTEILLDLTMAQLLSEHKMLVADHYWLRMVMNVNYVAIIVSAMFALALVTLKRQD